ncbi:hypothetical protein J4T85_035335 (plasmid) [Sinorhizobium medicae]|uniref:hypothetical protein n=1 Tax=Sinorhizobium medicae TaxID=110321 RepID=UPI001AAE3778|nr:hypothetical protein [Sinorhizobium medicae]
MRRLILIVAPYRCALEVNSLRRELSAKPHDESLSGFSSRYDEILGRYNVNHDTVDYDKYRLEHPDEFPSVAAEDTASARKAISRTDHALNIFMTTVITITAGLTALAVGSPLFSDIINGVLRWFGLQ